MIQAQLATWISRLVPIDGRTTTTEVTSKFVRAAARPIVAAVRRVRPFQILCSAASTMALAWVSTGLDGK